MSVLGRQTRVLQSSSESLLAGTTYLATANMKMFPLSFQVHPKLISQTSLMAKVTTRLWYLRRPKSKHLQRILRGKSLQRGELNAKKIRIGAQRVLAMNLRNHKAIILKSTAKSAKVILFFSNQRTQSCAWFCTIECHPKSSVASLYMKRKILAYQSKLFC